MMDLYPQAKLLSFSCGDISAKNSKNRKNHTGEKSPLRGGKFNFHCFSTWPCSPGSHEQESVLFTANEINLTAINVPKNFRIWERFVWQVGRLRVILNRDRIHMNFGEFRWIQWWFRSTVDGAQYRPLNSGEFSPIPQQNSSEFTKNGQICAGQERPWPCKRSSALFEPRAAPSVRKTPLFYGLGTKLQITIF